MNVARTALPAGAALFALSVSLPAGAFGPPDSEVEASGQPGPSETSPEPTPVGPSGPEPDSEPEPAPDAEPEPAPDAEPEPAPDAEPEPAPDAEPEPESLPDAELAPEPDSDSEGGPAPSITPPRVDGAYFGATFAFDLAFATVLDLETPDPFLTGVGVVQVGQAVLPWLYLGVALAGGGGGTASTGQLTYHGGFLVHGGVYPVPKYPLSLRVGLGFGAGAITDPDETARFGFGGAMFQGAVRYEFFPLAKKLRPRRGGGWAIGPELGWLGYTPAGPGQPFMNNVYLGISTGFYFGS